MIESSGGGHLDIGEVTGATERSQAGTSRPALTLVSALLSAFSASLTVGIITLRWGTGVSEFGEAFVEARQYFEWLPPIPLVIVVSIFSAVWFVRRLGYARVLLTGALSQAICLAAVGLMPVAFEAGGSSSASSLWLFAAYLANAAKGLCDGAAFLMIASFFSGRDRHAWGRLLACWIAASLVLNLISQNISAMPVVVAIGAVAALSLGACSIGLWNASLTDAIDPRSARQKVWSFVSPAFIVLLVLSTATWYVGSFDASKFLRFGLGADMGAETVSKSRLAVDGTFIVIACLVDYVRKYVKDYDLLFCGAICFGIGIVRLALAKEPDHFGPAWLFVSAGSAISLPLIFSWTVAWFDEGTPWYVAFLLAFSLLGSFVGEWATDRYFGASLNLETYRQSCWIGAVVAGILVTLYTIQIFWKRDGFVYRFLMGMHLPKNRTLQMLLNWCFYGMLTSVIVLPEPEDLQQVIGQYMLTFVYGYIFGPFWSPLWFVSLFSNLLAFYIFCVIVMRARDQVPQAKQAFSILFLLGMFSIWVEPWMRLDSILLNLAEMALNTSVLLYVDIAVTIGWIWALRKVHQRFSDL